MLNEIWANICEQWIQPVSGKWREIIIFAIFYFTVVDVGVFFGFSFMHIVTFIPGIIFVPSERRRYRFK